MENGSTRSWNHWRIARWSFAVILLVLPLVAMQFTSEVNLSFGDFLFAGVLLFGSLGAYEVVSRMTGNSTYRIGFGVAITTALLLIWVNGAVGITDSDADGMYFVVVAVGIIGAFIARFQPAGMARAMLATALAQALVGVIALIAGIVPAFNSTFEILGITGFFVALFVGSALLFRVAARGDAKRSAG